MMRFLTFVLCAFVCSGCLPAATNTAEMQSNRSLHSQFDIDSSLQASIKKISYKWNECQPPYLSEHIVLLDELGEARMEFRDMNNRMWLLVELQKNAGKTRVDVSSYRSVGWESAFRILEHGAKGLPGCP